MSLSWSLDKIGPLCLTADDCGLVLEAIAGPDHNDHTSTERPYVYEPPQSTPDEGFRLAVLDDQTEGAEDAVRDGFLQAIEDLNAVATVETITLPDLPYVAVASVIHLAESASAFDEFIESGAATGLTGAEDRYPYARSTVLAKDYLKAQRLRGVIGKAFDEALSGYHALVAPTAPMVASPVDEPLRHFFQDGPDDIVGAVGNAAGLPAISVPGGFSDGGLPIGIQFVARAYDENAILDVARTYQSLTDWHRRHPPDP